MAKLVGKGHRVWEHAQTQNLLYDFCPEKKRMALHLVLPHFIHSITLPGADLSISLTLLKLSLMYLVTALTIGVMGKSERNPLLED